jgi:amino-acid N-acetyltransferase
MQVRFVARDAIRRQLDNDNIVLLSNLGFTAAGEVLNCNTYDVGLHAAVELNADKLICLHLDDVKGAQGIHVGAAGMCGGNRKHLSPVAQCWLW